MGVLAICLSQHYRADLRLPESKRPSISLCETMTGDTLTKHGLVVSCLGFLEIVATDYSGKSTPDTTHVISYRPISVLFCPCGIGIAWQSNDTIM